jgi:hypothetical protein
VTISHKLLICHVILENPCTRFLPPCRRRATLQVPEITHLGTPRVPKSGLHVRTTVKVGLEAIQFGRDLFGATHFASICQPRPSHARAACPPLDSIFHRLGRRRLGGKITAKMSPLRHGVTEKRSVSLAGLRLQPTTPVTAVRRSCSGPDRFLGCHRGVGVSPSFDASQGCAMNSWQIGRRASLHNYAVKQSGCPVTSLASIVGGRGSGPVSSQGRARPSRSLPQR